VIKIPIVVTLIIFTLSFLSAYATDRLVVIQAVSSSKKTLIISRGMSNGITVGQEAVFATKNISFLARAIEVTPVFSQWKVATRKGAIPFDKGQVVLMGGNPNTIWGTGVGIKSDTISETQNIPSSLSVNSALSREFSDRYFKTKNNWIVKGSYSLAISESVSDTVSSQEITRAGLQIEALFSTQLTPTYELSFGGRLDNENQETKEPALSVPTIRIIAMANFNYHFYEHFQEKNHFYMGTSIGLGQSTTTVGEVSSTGYCMILPSITLGLEMKKGRGNYSMIIEGVAESINSKESFPDGTVQSTNIINAKIGVGIKF
jgi:hypothetical protein